MATYEATFECTLDAMPDFGDLELFAGPTVAITVPHPYGATLATLRKRAQYGGRKGRAAARRLASGRFNASGGFALRDRTVTTGRDLHNGTRVTRDVR